jgi:hypothetical protein
VAWAKLKAMGQSVFLAYVGLVVVDLIHGVLIGPPRWWIDGSVGREQEQSRVTPVLQSLGALGLTAVFVWRELTMALLLGVVPNKAKRQNYAVLNMIVNLAMVKAIFTIRADASRPDLLGVSLTWILVGVSIVKVCLAGKLLLTLKAGFNGGVRFGYQVLILWTITWIASSIIACCLVPEEVLPRHVLVLGMLVLVPLNRVLVLPVWIARVRHQ